MSALETYGFETLLPGKMSYAEQISAASAAEIIISAHGAGLTNIGFARPGTIVIELTASSYMNVCFAHLTRLMGQRHVTIVSPPAAPGDQAPTADVGLVLDSLRRCGVSPRVGSGTL